MRKRSLAICIALVLLLSACRVPAADVNAGSTNAPETQPGQTTPVAPDATSGPGAAQGAPGALKLALTDMAGRNIEVPSRPGKIISLSPAVTEIIYALGCGSSLIGVGVDNDFPAEAAAVAKFKSDDVNAIVQAAPQVVFVPNNSPQADVDELTAAGVCVVYAEAATYPSVYGSIAFVAQIMEVDASPVIENMQATILEISGRENDFESVNVLFITGVEGETFACSEKASFPNMLIALLGSASVTETMESAALSAAQIQAANPQVIVVSDDIDLEKLKQMAGMQNISAVKDGRVYPMDMALVQRPGPRIVDGVDALFDILEQAAVS